MNVRCEKCGVEYDDAARWTICPHQELASAAVLALRDAAIRMLGQDVRFNHQRIDGPTRHVIAVTGSGTIILRDLPGEYAPELFVIVREP